MGILVAAVVTGLVRSCSAATGIIIVIAGQRSITLQADIVRLTDSAALRESRRLVAQELNRLAAYTVEMDVIEKRKRIYYRAKRMAKDTMPKMETPAQEQAA